MSPPSSAPRIGVLSDTHGHLDPYLHDLFAGVERIFHGGDIGPESIVDELETIAPVTAVAGNTDHGLSDHRFGVFRVGEAAGLRFLLTHIVDDPLRPGTELARRIGIARARVVVYGHTHVPRARTAGDVLFLNPGSAGPRRFDYPRSACIVEVRDGVPIPTFHDLERRAPFAPAER